MSPVSLLAHAIRIIRAADHTEQIRGRDDASRLTALARSGNRELIGSRGGTWDQLHA